MTINQTSIKSVTTPTRIKSLAVLAIGAVFMAACGGGVPITEQANSAPASAESAEATQDAAAAPTGVAATLGDTLLGEVLIGPNGMTLYGFTNDAQAASTCYGTCADAWPPVIVERDFALAPALDEGAFATTERDDGSFQLVAGKWPLYYFAGDAVPGDAKGQGSGDVWFAVDGVGTLILDSQGDAAGSATDETEAAANETGNEAAESTPVNVVEGPLGDMLVDSQGLSLYGFTNDADGNPTCEGACADAWPAMIVDGGKLPAGLDPEVFSLVERPDGQQQLKVGKWPLYYFAGDAAAGDINGQGSGDVWFLAAPDGSLLKGEESAAAPSPAPAAGSADSSESDSDSGYGYSS